MGIQIQPFAPFAGATNTVNLAVTASSQTLACGLAGRLSTYRLACIGTQTIFVAAGEAGTTPIASASTSMPLMGNTVETFTFPTNMVIAAIASGTGSTLYVTAGDSA